MSEVGVTDIASVQKVCRKCGTVKPISKFYARQGTCKECVKASQRRRNAEWAATHTGGVNEFTPQEKRCTVCGDVKPISEFYPDRYHKDGFAYQCKHCSTRHLVRGVRPPTEAQRHQLILIAQGKKRCAKCGEVKVLSEFNRSRRKGDGYLSQCKPCLSHTHQQLAERNRARKMVIDPSSPTRCSRCGGIKPASSFHFEPHRKSGLSLWCKDCVREKDRKHRFGVTAEDMERLLSAQNKTCAICGKPISEKTAHVDHDHVTGEIRGLLCGKCNPALGLFGDNEETILRAAIYLESYRKKRKAQYEFCRN